MDAHRKAELKKLIDSDESNWAYMQSSGWTYLTDWTFTSILSLQCLMKEGAELMEYYSGGKSSKGRFTKFMITFSDRKGCLDLWGKLEEDYQI